MNTACLDSVGVCESLHAPIEDLKDMITQRSISTTSNESLVKIGLAKNNEVYHKLEFVVV